MLRSGWSGAAVVAGLVALVACGSDDGDAPGSSVGGTQGVGSTAGSGSTGLGSSAGSGGGGSVGTSWNELDPPQKDTAKADTYCQLAIDQFQIALPYYRDQIGPIANFDDLYFVSRMMDGMTAVIEVKGNKQVASDLLDVSLAIVGAGEDRNGDGYLDYCSRNADGSVKTDCSTSSVGSQGNNPCCDDDGSKMPTDTWYSLRGLARTLRAAKATGLQNERAAEYEKLRAFLRHDLIDKWLDLDGEGPDQGQRGSNNAGILSQMAGILLDYYAATGEQLIGDLSREWVLRISTDMEPSKDHPGAYQFDNNVKAGATFDGYTDTNHSNYLVATLIEGFEAGYLTYDFLDPLQVNFADLIWNQSEDNPLFAGYVDGTSDESRPLWPDNVYFGWMRLGQFKGKSQKVASIINYTHANTWAIIETNGNLCRNYAIALTSYPVKLPLQ